LKQKLNVLHLAMMGTLIVPLTSGNVFAEGGIASVYSTREGTRTASGVRLNDNALTAAHRSLPFGTKVRVTNNKNGHSVVVTVTDRGPFVRGRVIDLTPAGARALGFSGLASVSLETSAYASAHANKGEFKVAKRRGHKAKRHFKSHIARLDRGAKPASVA
jgi:rare lipoprotein A